MATREASPRLARGRALLFAGVLALGLVALFVLRQELEAALALSAEDLEAGHRRLYGLARAVLAVFAVVLAGAGLGLLHAAVRAWPTARPRALLAAALGAVALAGALALPPIALRHVAATLAATRERLQPPIEWQLRTPRPPPPADRPGDDSPP